MKKDALKEVIREEKGSRRWPERVVRWGGGRKWGEGCGVGVSLRDGEGKAIRRGEEAKGEVEDEGAIHPTQEWMAGGKGTPFRGEGARIPLSHFLKETPEP